MVSEAPHPSPVSTVTTSSTSSELELIEQLKRQLAGPLFTAVSSRLESYQNRLQYAELKIRLLEKRLRLVRIAKYGPGSEKFSDAHWSCWNWSRESAMWKFKRRASAQRYSPRRRRSAIIRGGRNCPRTFRG